MNVDTTPNFSATMKRVFGLPNQSLVEFKKELDTLDNEDRRYYHRILNDAGYECKEPAYK